MIELVISGGQTGADQAGWRAAKSSGIATAGWMPKGFKTEDGPRPDFAELYGAKEHSSAKYEDRTPLNVRDADCTICFGDMDSRGSRLAYRCYKDKVHAEGPRFRFITSLHPGWIPVYRHKDSGYLSWDALLVAETLHHGNHKRVNIAGNRESSKPGIGAWVERFMLAVFAEMRRMESKP